MGNFESIDQFAAGRIASCGTVGIQAVDHEKSPWPRGVPKAGRLADVATRLMQRRVT